MKKYLLVLLAGSTLAFNLTWAQPSPQSSGLALPEDYILVKATNSLTKFDLDFPGGTPGDLVKAVEKATGKPLNTIIPDDCADLKMFPVSVKNVTVPQLFEVLIQASQSSERFTVLDPRDRSIGGNGSDIYVADISYGFSTVGMATENSIWYFHRNGAREQKSWQVLSSTVCKFYQMEPYLEAGYKVEDVTTAVETAWKMLGTTNTPAMSYHKDTKVLIVVGKQDQVDLVGDVLKQLSTTPKEKSAGKDLPKAKDQ